MLPFLGDAVKKLLFLRQVWRFMLSGKDMACFQMFEDNQGAVQLVCKTQRRTRIPRASMYVTPFWETTRCPPRGDIVMVGWIWMESHL